jgi:hypothetical protein
MTLRARTETAGDVGDEHEWSWGCGEAAAAGREDQGGVAELGFVAGGRAAPAGVPDPELVEQAKRRSFTAKYKLEILAKADACTAPGEVGELLRREGLYTSHLTYWRKQRKDGALKELGKPARAQAGRSARRGDRGADAAAERSEAELAKMKRSWRFRETSQRCWRRCSVPRARRGAPSDDRRHRRGADADHRHPAGVPGARARPQRRVPPPPAARAAGRPGRGRRLSGRCRARARALVLEVLHSERFVDVSPEETWATLLDEGTYLCSTRTMYRILAAQSRRGPRAARPAHPPAVRQARAARRAAERAVVLGREQAEGPGEVDLLLPVRDSRRVQPLHRRLDRPVPRERQLATALIEQATEQQQITPKILTLHADRGAPHARQAGRVLSLISASRKRTAGRTPPATTPTRSRTSRP